MSDWTLHQNLRKPQRTGWRGLTDLFEESGPKAAVCVLWMFSRLERGKAVSARAMQREFHVKPKTATKLIKLWLPLVQYEVNGARPGSAQFPDYASVTQAPAPIRETSVRTSVSIEEPAIVEE